MKIWKKTILFYIGGCLYVALEYLWRGWSHSSMFLLGGACFLALGLIQQKLERLPLAVQELVGALVITALELACGLLVNRDFAVWDYRAIPLNYRGQICLRFTLLWVPVSLAGIVAYRCLIAHLPET